MFWFSRKSKVVLDCFTHLDYVYEHSPIEYARDNIPSWFKNMDKTYVADEYIPRSTLKKCPAIISTLTSGIYISLWTDLAFNIRTVSNDGKHIQKELQWNSADNRTMIESQAREQWDAFAGQDKIQHIKIDPAWYFKTKEDINFYWTQPYYHRENNLISVSPGIDNYKSISNTSINGFVDLSTDRQFIIKQGTPIVQLIPMSDKNVVIKNHFVSEKEFNSMQVKPFTYLDYWKKLSKPKLKCPFHK